VVDTEHVHCRAHKMSMSTELPRVRVPQSRRLTHMCDAALEQLCAVQLAHMAHALSDGVLQRMRPHQQRAVHSCAHFFVKQVIPLAEQQYAHSTDMPNYNALTTLLYSPPYALVVKSAEKYGDIAKPTNNTSSKHAQQFEEVGSV